MATFRAGFRAITFTLSLVIPNSLQDYPNIIVALENYRVKRCATSCPGDWACHAAFGIHGLWLPRPSDALLTRPVTLNHTMRGVMGIYNRHEYAAERKRALGAWASSAA
jgi:hypothetical protein